MKKLLLIGLLIVGCIESDTTAPEPEDCAGVAVVDCISGVCTETPENVELWGECYNIEETNSIIIIVSNFNEEIPVEIGKLTNLIALILNNNQLTGEIPPEIGNLTNLMDLRIYNNQLTGEIPSEIGNLTNLDFLYLNNNQLTGEIPQQVCDLIESNNLDINNILSGNNLTNTCD